MRNNLERGSDREKRYFHGNGERAKEKDRELGRQ